MTATMPWVNHPTAPESAENMPRERLTVVITKDSGAHNGTVWSHHALQIRIINIFRQIGDVQVSWILLLLLQQTVIQKWIPRVHIWYGMPWCCIAWYYMIWRGITWYGVVLHGMTWSCIQKRWGLCWERSDALECGKEETRKTEKKAVRLQPEGS